MQAEIVKCCRVVVGYISFYIELPDWNTLDDRVLGTVLRLWRE